MEKNIYDLINEIDTDIESYQKHELTPLEEKRILRRFSKTIKKKQINRNHKKYMSAAVAALIVVGTVGVIPTIATTNPGIYKIATALGIEKDLAPYETVIGQALTADGLTMIINEVIIDNNELLVSVTTKSETPIKDTYRATLGSVYINGKEINMGSYGEATLIDDHTGHTLTRIPLGKNYEGKLDIKLKLKTSIEGKWIRNWDYEFTADGDTLKADTETIDLNQTITLLDNQTMTLEIYQGNPVSHSISYNTNLPSDYNYELTIRGIDEKGNEVIFEKASITYGNTGEFVVAKEDHDIVNHAKTLTLGLYADDTLQGEIFEINK